MAFKVRKLDYRPWPVTVKCPECQPDGSVIMLDQRFIAHFEVFDEADLLALRSEIFGGKNEAERDELAKKRTSAEQAELEAQFLSRLVRGWEAVSDDAGRPIPFSRDAVRGLCLDKVDGPVFRQGLSQAGMEIRFGMAPAKNAEPSPAPGPSPSAGEAETK